ncbi:MAG: hypothetical protein WC324_02085 [Candidatus Omnitrophota bacterium]|jgi:hypothetical protein
MAAKNATNGYIRMVSTDTFTTDSPSKMFLPRALSWAGTTGASKCAITDADGVTVCYMSVGAAGGEAVRTKEFYGEARPWKTPITATMSSGMLLIVV